MPNKDLKFKIQDKEFSVPENYAGLFEFEVKSSPRPYKVNWKDEADLSAGINSVLSENPNNLLLIDKAVHELLGAKLAAPKERIYIVESTEEAKTLEGCMSVVDFLQGRNFTKAETLVVVGGGVVQDIGAFVGAVFKRGIPWVFFPTTLLAMCDSCIGGKTGINYKGAKNQLALFSAPRSVIINPEFLKTLPERELKAGLGEMLKLHTTGGMEMLKDYEVRVEGGKIKEFGDYRPLILGSLMVKKAVIEADEFELDLRRSLNYGHTFGHALESVTDFAIPHGQAVALGMILVDELSALKDILPAEEKTHVQKLCLDLIDGDITAHVKRLQAGELVELLKKDKKTLGTKVNLVVLKHIGETIFVQVPLGATLAEEVKNIITKVFGQ